MPSVVEGTDTSLDACQAKRLTQTLGVTGNIEWASLARRATTLEEKVEFLLRRDQEAQRNVNDLSARLADLESTTSHRLDEARGQMESHVANEISEALANFRTLRIVGVVALTIGLCLATAKRIADALELTLAELVRDL